MKINLFFFMAALMSSSAFAGACPALLDHKFKTVTGTDVDLCQYADRAILVVNTASRCGYTPQFSKLQALYDQYKDKGFVVVGFPSNDFRQELTTNKEVGEFCQVNYGVSFPMMEKSSVTGAGANSLYKQLTQFSGEAPAWNFHKYLISPGGKDVYSFATRLEPDAPEILVKLKPMLK